MPGWRSTKSARKAMPLGVCFCALLAGCSPLQTLNEISDDGAYQRVADLAYGSAQRQRLDLYLPNPLPANAPLVVFFYGGGWRSGEKANYEFAAASLAAEGLVVAVPDYRLWPEVAFPQFVEDGAAALGWLSGHARDWGVSAERTFLMGHSAGAHIAALLALEPAYRASGGAGDLEITGWVGLSGPYDFLPIEDGYLLEVFPAPSRPESQPINHVSSDDPPALLIHGGDDDVVAPENSERLAAALDQAGVAVDLRIFDDRGHAAVAAALAPPLDFIASTREESLTFIQRLATP